MCELWAPGAFSDRPDTGRGRLEAIVDGDVATRVQLDAGHVQADRGGIGRASRRDQDVAAFDGPFTVRRAHDKADAISGPPLHLQRLRCHEQLDPFVTENSSDRIGDVPILATRELWPSLDDRDAAPEAPVRLSQLEG